MYYQTTYKSPLGILYLVSNEENLIGLWLEGQKYFQATLKEEPINNDQIEIQLLFLVIVSLAQVAV